MISTNTIFLIICIRIIIISWFFIVKSVIELDEYPGYFNDITYPKSFTKEAILICNAIYCCFFLEAILIYVIYNLLKYLYRLIKAVIHILKNGLHK